MGIKASRHSASGAEGPWEDLLASVLKRRSYDARFYKPVCLIAVIDAVEAGEIAVSDIDPHRVIERFDRYVRPVFPDRAMMGWRPFWHLSNDGAWRFRRLGRSVGPETFGRERKPNSLGRLLTSIDHVAVSDEMRQVWRDRAARAALRQALLEMLDADDAECRMMADILGSSETRTASVSPVEPIEAVGRRSGGQGFLASSKARIAVERRAMDLVRAHLENLNWMVDDVSATRSFDFLCRQQGRDPLYVEVKGTTGPAASIQLTHAEVEFAKAHLSQMALVIVSDINLVEADDDFDATGGVVTMQTPWAPDPDRLRPISYNYDLM